jgi:hypothetical protein
LRLATDRALRLATKAASAAATPRTGAVLGWRVACSDMWAQEESPVKIREPKNSSPTHLEKLFARALSRARVRTGVLVGGPAMAGAMALGGVAGCVDMPEVGSQEQTDWVQYEGQRNTDMVSYVGQFWAECANPNTRFGCGTVDVFVKLRVKPVQGASLDYKEVGVVTSNPFDNEEKTAYGYYFSTWDNGDEEWHVRVSVPSWRDFFTFNAFYRDGAGHTFYDDNRGELHVVNAGPDQQIVRVNTYNNTAEITPGGLSGKISVRVADLDFDKKLRMVATVDGWQNVLEFGQGLPGEKNVWYWVQDVYGGELWEIDLDLSGDIDVFEYAVQYQHGVVNDATAYGFWANNNGYNYRIERPVVD